MQVLILTYCYIMTTKTGSRKSSPNNSVKRKSNKIEASPDNSDRGTSPNSARMRHKRISVPLYGPLNIENIEDFMKEQKEIFHKCFPMSCPSQKSVDEFEPIALLGEGGFGKVYLVIYKKTDKFYAMKRMEKKFLAENDYITFALNEKRILQSLNFPFCVRLEFLSQDKTHIFFFLPFISGGELFTHLKKFKKFEENLAKFYAGQVVLALEFLHFCDLVYRDLKPENILIDQTGYIKVTDFGFTKQVKHRLYTFCGTPEYIAPEIVLGLGHSKAVDYWSLGCMIYELVKGKTPFHGENDMETFRKIVAVEYEMPPTFSEPLQHLITNLLQADTSRRYGNLQNGVEDIKQTLWFEDINWLTLLNRKAKPLYIPESINPITNFPQAEEVLDVFREMKYIHPFPNKIQNKILVLSHVNYSDNEGSNHIKEPNSSQAEFDDVLTENQKKVKRKTENGLMKLWKHTTIN